MSEESKIQDLIVASLMRFMSLCTRLFFVILLLLSGNVIFAASSVLSVPRSHDERLSGTFSQVRNLNVVRSPNGTVYQYEPVLIFVQLPEAPASFNASVSVSIRLYCETSGFGLPSCPNGGNLGTQNYDVPLIPFPGSNNEYFSLVPGLPAQLFCVPFTGCNEWVMITSNVTYSIYFDSQTINYSSYTVQVGNYTPASVPPIVGSFVASSLSDAQTTEETFGLSPKGWVAGDGESVPIVVVSFSQAGIKTVESLFSIDGGTWNQLQLKNDSIQETLDNITQIVNDFINSFNSVFCQFPLYFCVGNIWNPISVQDATIPPVNLGHYVMFKGIATDENGVQTTSPEGFYYVVNMLAKTRVLVIDPHVELWLLLQNLNMYARQTNSDLGYGLPLSVFQNSTLLLKVSSILNRFEAGQFHYWNLLGEYYNITISFPNSNLENLLQTVQEGGFQPNIIYLSDLSLGFSPKSNSSPSQFFNWDLNQIYDKNGNTILSDIIDYVKSKHAALIGSSGVLSDWHIWDSCSSTNSIQIGSRGNIGGDVGDGNPSEQTLAPMFGMPLLPVFEYARDQIASDVCSLTIPGAEAAGNAVGSLPLMLPIAPWNGTLENAFSFKGPSSQINWNYAIMNGLPSTLSISMPNVYSQFGYNATNTLGWQLSLPNLLALAAWNSANELREQAREMEQNFSYLSQNLTRSYVNSTYLDYSLERGLRDFYGGIVGASMNQSGVSLTMYIPTIQQNESFFIPVNWSEVMSATPVEIGALSPDSSAGIVTYDKYYDPNGYRSVYFSFPAESSNQSEVAISLISNAISWAQDWSYRPASSLGGVIASSNNVQTFDWISEQGSEISSWPLFTNELGRSNQSFYAGSTGNYSILILHPYSNVTVKDFKGEILNASQEEDNISIVNSTVTSPGMVYFSISSDPQSSLTPVYVENLYFSSRGTQSSSTTTSSSSTTSSTSTTTITSSLTSTVSISSGSRSSTLPVLNPSQILLIVSATILSVSAAFIFIVRKRR
jgi:hypothetical protein